MKRVSRITVYDQNLSVTDKGGARPDLTYTSGNRTRSPPTISDLAHRFWGLPRKTDTTLNLQTSYQIWDCFDGTNETADATRCGCSVLLVLVQLGTANCPKQPAPTANNLSKTSRRLYSTVEFRNQNPV